MGVGGFLAGCCKCLVAFCCMLGWFLWVFVGLGRFFRRFWCLESVDGFGLFFVGFGCFFLRVCVYVVGCCKFLVGFKGFLTHFCICLCLGRFFLCFRSVFVWALVDFGGFLCFPLLFVNFGGGW